MADSTQKLKLRISDTGGSVFVAMSLFFCIIIGVVGNSFYHFVTLSRCLADWIVAST